MICLGEVTPAVYTCKFAASVIYRIIVAQAFLIECKFSVKPGLNEIQGKARVNVELFSRTTK